MVSHTIKLKSLIKLNKTIMMYYSKYIFSPVNYAKFFNVKKVLMIK